MGKSTREELIVAKASVERGIDETPYWRTLKKMVN